MHHVANRVYILCSDKTSRLYNAWLPRLSLPYEFVENYNENWQPPADAGIVLTHLHYEFREVAVLRRALRENRVPLLVLADGILEFRNTFEHPQLAPGAIFQPLMAHKLACIGRSQARIVESWNHPGVCEVVGLPYLDNVRPPAPARDLENKEFRILIATARKPGFTQTQIRQATQAVFDVKQWLAQHPLVGGRKLCPLWRLTLELGKEIGLDPEVDEISSGVLADEFSRTDAVITTPSTLALEAALFQIPVAVLDYTNSPHFVPAAWTISAPRHVPQIVPQLMQPAAAKMLFQQNVLFDALESSSSATPRMVKLVERMVQTGQHCREEGGGLHVPLRILESTDYGSDFHPIAYDLAELYPKFPQIRIHDALPDAVVSAHRDLEASQLAREILAQNDLISSQRQEIKRLEMSAQQSSQFIAYRNALVARIERTRIARFQWAARMRSDLFVVESLNRLMSYREALARSPAGRVPGRPARSGSSRQHRRTRPRRSIRISPRWKASGVLSLLRSYREKTPASPGRLRLHHCLTFAAIGPKQSAGKKRTRRAAF